MLVCCIVAEIAVTSVMYTCHVVKCSTISSTALNKATTDSMNTKLFDLLIVGSVLALEGLLGIEKLSFDVIRACFIDLR